MGFIQLFFNLTSEPIQGTYTVVAMKATGTTVQHSFSVEEYGNCHCNFKFLTASSRGHEILIEQRSRSDQDVQHHWKFVSVSFPPKNHLFRRRILEDLSDLSLLLPKPQTMECSPSECPPQQGSYQEEQSAWISLC